MQAGTKGVRAKSVGLVAEKRAPMKRKSVDEAMIQRGVKALLEALGPVDMIRFLAECGHGTGDFTRDRHKLTPKRSLDDMEKIARERRGNLPEPNANK
jgi:hypothetical protein